MHNMMVKAQEDMDETEDGTMYDMVDDGAVDTETHPGDDGDDDSIHLGDCLIDGVVNRDIWDKSTKFEMLHKWREVLHDFEELA